MLLFVYNRKLLASVLEKSGIKSYLADKKYPVQEGFDAVLHELVFRLTQKAPFPHEIGLFLGYPLEDVDGFIRHEGAFAKYSGYWKVYGDTANALKTMKLYKTCRDYCTRLVAGGMSIPSAAEKYRLFWKGTGGLR